MQFNKNKCNGFTLSKDPSPLVSKLVMNDQEIDFGVMINSAILIFFNIVRKNTLKGYNRAEKSTESDRQNVLVSC